MNMSGKGDTCCEGASECRVESILGVDERGQMVLPKELRERAGIKSGDKLAVISHQKDGQLCCLTLISVESLNEMVKGVLGPVMKDIIPR
ncbi:MAG: AbrB/MazE/SpoVT family DNA-binding domain-containing protein [Actinobacteria bacterium]|nr:AbrB/MazE/SpoVT family DNA-binding domain-containing protein [Actinomycetota bacterium]